MTRKLADERGTASTGALDQQHTCMEPTSRPGSETRGPDTIQRGERGMDHSQQALPVQ